MAKLQMGKAVEQRSMRWPSLTPSELKPFTSIVSCSVAPPLSWATEATHRGDPWALRSVRAVRAQDSCNTCLSINLLASLS